MAALALVRWGDGLVERTYGASRSGLGFSDPDMNWPSRRRDVDHPSARPAGGRLSVGLGGSAGAGPVGGGGARLQ